ncbi:hypothetical protein, partial [Aureimonas sp. Leaf454]|uniref:hypothetical protein n=1 Tax=Aureimonas sp. Leaf454 TaxID=1736381 RepID=UPI001AEC6820
GENSELDQGLTSPTSSKPGQFLMEILGQLSVEINSLTICDTVGIVISVWRGCDVDRHWLRPLSKPISVKDC